MADGYLWKGLQILIALFAVGMLFYTYVEDLTPLDAFYLTGSTLTTLGYGDIVPETPAGKIFTVIYSIAGIGTIFYISGNIFSFFASKHIEPSKILHRKKKKN